MKNKYLDSVLKVLKCDVCGASSCKVEDLVDGDDHLGLAFARLACERRRSALVEAALLDLIKSSLEDVEPLNAEAHIWTISIGDVTSLRAADPSFEAGRTLAKLRSADRMRHELKLVHEMLTMTKADHDFPCKCIECKAKDRVETAMLDWDTLKY